VRIERDVPVSDEGKAWRVRRTRAQEIARSKRRGNFGLAKAIMQHSAGHTAVIDPAASRAQHAGETSQRANVGGGVA
jgi:hypothetical protein